MPSTEIVVVVKLADRVLLESTLASALALSSVDILERLLDVYSPLNLESSLVATFSFRSVLFLFALAAFRLADLIVSCVRDGSQQFLLIDFGLLTDA